jgi:fido (protein-threonine AMPylation protein)
MRAQIEYRAFPEAVIAARYHHRMVSTHPFPNGNGRHARFMADLLLKELTGKIFTWGQNSLDSGWKARTAYIKALQAADGGDYGPLLFFLGITSS